MTKGIINNFNFVEDFDCMRYWSFPSSYSKEKKAEQLNQILYSGDYLAAEKKDGYFQRIVKDNEGNIFMCSRNKGVNGVIEKHEWVPHLNSFFDSLPNGTCLLGEIYLDGKTSKGIVSILGCLKDKAIQRQSEDENKLRFYVFDVLAHDGVLCYKMPMEKRVECLKNIQEEHSVNEYVEFAEYLSESDLIHELWLTTLAQGGEGVVLTRKDYPYEFKKRKARATLKLKKELEETIDVFLTGRYKAPTHLYTGTDITNWKYWYDEIKQEKFYGTLSERQDITGFTPVTRLWYNQWAAAVEVAVIKEGKEFAIGWISGITDDIRKEIVKSSKNYHGRVLELQAMEIDRSGSVPTLRHAKIVRWRDDKNAIDCGYEQLL